MAHYCFVWLWLVFGRSPEILYLEDGQRIPLKHGYRISRTAFCYRDFRKQFFLVPNRLVDFKKTFALPKKPKPKPPRRRSNREIPWDHANFRDKMVTRRVIEITSGDLKTYDRRRTPAEKKRAELAAVEVKPSENKKPLRSGKKPGPVSKKSAAKKSKKRRSPEKR